MAKKSEPSGEPSMVGINVRRIREARPWDIEELAAASGVHRVTISRVENGQQEHFNTPNLIAIASALEVTVDYLVSPAGSSPVAPLVEKFRRGRAKEMRPPATDHELERVLALPELTWVGMEPTETTIEKMIDAFRSGAKLQEL